MISYSDFALEDAALASSHPPVQPLAGPHGEGHSILGPNAQGAFLKSLQLFGNVRLACRAAGVSAQTAYRVRRRSALFAQLWDAALVAARAHAEATLADRAINGVEEPVFYHGEEIARRRRYSDRLLLAHLARLDRMEAREDVSALLPLLDDAIAALDEGADLSEVLERAAPAAGAACGGEVAAQGPENKPQDSVPSVPSCRVSHWTPCEECGGQCADPDAELTEADCQWLGNRLDRMDAARPDDAPTPYDLAREGEGENSGAIEAAQLAAFEAGVAEWWLVTGFDELVESLCETGFNDSAEGDMLPLPQGERDHELEDGYWETDERLWPRARRRRGARHGGGSGAGR
ncbi:hypothetical protein MACH24_24010 [Erythrobacter sp. Dej080120_24]|uniref:hypothetical protein n=1 Tax=Erythrobacter sp. Dej080120_24 TaxID=3024837 RepID=UPI0029253C90|nr:hypothetical protein MACH24_24010 [Erythrobacter sp. Dej080120_24]